MEERSDILFQRDVFVGDALRLIRAESATVRRVTATDGAVVVFRLRL